MVELNQLHNFQFHHLTATHINVDDDLRQDIEELRIFQDLIHQVNSDKQMNVVHRNTHLYKDIFKTKTWI
jgi:hypothetical protein